MAGAQMLLNLPYQAGGAITKQRFLKISGDQTVVQCDAAGEDSEGVTDRDVSAAEATSGKQVPLYAMGVVWVTAGAAIARRALVATDNQGRAVTAATGNRILGKAMKAAAAAGDLIPVFFAGAVKQIAP